MDYKHKRAERRYYRSKLRKLAFDEMERWIYKSWGWYSRFGRKRNKSFEEYYEEELRSEIRKYMKDDGKRYHWYEKPDDWILPYQSARETERLNSEYLEWIKFGQHEYNED